MKLDALVAIDVQKAFVNDAVSHVPGEVDDAIDHVAQTSGRIYTPTCVQGDAGEPAPTDRPASPVQGSANAETALDAAADTTEIERTDHRVIGPALVATLEDPAIGRIGVCGIDTGGNVTGAVVDLVDAGLDTHLLAWASGSHAGAEEWEKDPGRARAPSRARPDLARTPDRRHHRGRRRGIHVPGAAGHHPRQPAARRGPDRLVEGPGRPSRPVSRTSPSPTTGTESSERAAA